MRIIANQLRYMLKHDDRRSRRASALIVAGAWVVYAGAYTPVQAFLGSGGIVSTLPMILTAWVYGIRGAVVGSLLVLLFNGSLSAITTDDSFGRWLTTGGLLGFGALLAVGIVVGWLRQLKASAEREIAERKRAESRLNDANLDLEQRVAARTEDLSESNSRLVNEVAERVLAEEGLHQRSREMEALFRIANVLSQPGTFDEKAHGVLLELGKVADSTRLVLRMVDGEAKELTVIAAIGANRVRTEPIFLGDTASPAHNPSFEAYRRAGPVIVNDYVSLDDARPDLREEGIESMAAFAITGEGRVLGTISIDSLNRNHFTLELVQLLTAVTNGLGPLLDNARLMEEAQRANQRLEEALFQLQRTQRQIIQQERLRAIGTMASGIAHDFNNELTPILGFAQLLLSDPSMLSDKDQTLKYLGMISDSAERAANIVGRLREFYRYRQDADVLTPTHLHDVIRNAVSLSEPMWRVEAQHNGTTVEMETDLQPVPQIEGDSRELESAVLNLILNALDAMPEGGSIAISTYPEDGDSVLRVKDSGIGMTEEVRKRCLEPFFSTKGERGTGMGLAMVYGITERHGGSLSIESEPGEGTTVTIRLPSLQSVGPAAEDKTNGEMPVAKPNPLHILVVDDEPVVSQVISEYLSNDGHLVETAGGGAEALRKFREGEFDLVLTDQAMPEMSGEQLASAIKRTRPQTRVLLLTGFGDMMKATGRRHADIDLIVGKPVTVSHLRQAIKEVTVR